MGSSRKWKRNQSWYSNIRISYKVKSLIYRVGSHSISWGNKMCDRCKDRDKQGVSENIVMVKYTWIERTWWQGQRETRDETSLSMETWFQESWKSCGGGRNGYWNLEWARNLSVMVLRVLWDVTVFPPQGSHPQDPEEDMRSQWDWWKYVEFKMRPKEVLGFEIKAEKRQQRI